MEASIQEPVTKVDMEALDKIIQSMPAIRTFNERMGQQWKSDADRVDALTRVCKRQFGLDIRRFLAP